MLAGSLTQQGVGTALAARRTFATRVPSLALALTANGEMMGSRVTLGSDERLTLDLYCHDSLTTGEYGATSGKGAAWTRLDIITNGGAIVGQAERRLTMHEHWRVTFDPDSSRDPERCYAVRALQGDDALAYSSPVWVRRR